MTETGSSQSTSSAVPPFPTAGHIVPEYFWYDPFGDDFAGFSLRDGVYEPISPDERGRLLSRKSGLALQRWQGHFRDYEAQWLRWETPDGKLLPTGEEMAEQERERAQEARRQAQEAQQRANELEATLARYRERFGEIPE